MQVACRAQRALIAAVATAALAEAVTPHEVLDAIIAKGRREGLLDAGADPNHSASRGQTPLMTAARAGNAALAERPVVIDDQQGFRRVVHPRMLLLARTRALRRRHSRYC